MGNLRKVHKRFAQESNKQLIRRMGRILKCLENYAKPVDVNMQHSPEITALGELVPIFLLMVGMMLFKNATKIKLT